MPPASCNCAGLWIPHLAIWSERRLRASVLDSDEFARCACRVHFWLTRILMCGNDLCGFLTTTMYRPSVDLSLPTFRHQSDKRPAL